MERVFVDTDHALDAFLLQNTIAHLPTRTKMGTCE
jgi:hypothetical protein